MKRKELKKIRTKSIEELHKQIGEEKHKLQELRMQLSLGELKDTQEVKKKRRDIAQILTIIYEKQLTENA